MRSEKHENPEDGTATAAGKGERGWKEPGFGSSLPIDFSPAESRG